MLAIGLPYSLYSNARPIAIAIGQFLTAKTLVRTQSNPSSRRAARSLPPSDICSEVFLAIVYNTIKVEHSSEKVQELTDSEIEPIVGLLSSISPLQHDSENWHN